jgi:stress response protein YsnF
LLFAALRCQSLNNKIQTMVLSNNRDIKSQLSELEKQLISYKVLDRQGMYRAKVADIYYDVSNELNLLIKLIGVDEPLKLQKLEARDISRLDLNNKQILSNLSDRQLENLPIYQPVPPHVKDALTESSKSSDRQMNLAHNDDRLLDRDVYQISLLEEKLQVNRRQQKVGEVVVRKHVETRMVKVPIRREKLIVERIGKNPERLTEVVVTEGRVNGFKYEELQNTDELHITKSHFLDIQTARQLLEALAHLSSVGNARVRLEIVTNCSEHQIEHQGICDRYQ